MRTLGRYLRLKVLLLLLIIPYTFYAQNLYWVGNSGDWNDPSHWSFSSGGKGGAGIPDASVSVIIDELSLEKSHFIEITTDVSCKNLDIHTGIEQEAITCFGQNNLIVHGNIQTGKGELSAFFGTLILKSNNRSTINIDGILPADIVFKGSESVYELKGNLNLQGSITLSEGSFNFGRNTVLCDKMNIQTEGDVKILNSNITCSDFSLRKESALNNVDLSNIIHFVQEVKAVFTIQSPAPSTPETCFGDCDGTFDLVLTSGTPTYPVTVTIYKPAPCGGGSLVYNNVMGLPWTSPKDGFLCGCGQAYNVKVVDFDGTTRWTQAPIWGPGEMIPTDTVIQNPQCNGDCDGQITINFIQGAAYPVEYLWSGTGSTDEFASTLCAGVNYTVTMTDFNGCVNSYTFAQLSSPTGVLATVDSIHHVQCKGGSTGEIFITPSGGTPGYFYNWSNADTDEDISGLVKGTYDVTVTDINGCTGTNSVIVNEPLFGLNLVFDSKVDVTCWGGNDGQIYVSANGGTTPYSWNWFTADGSGIAVGSEDQTTLTAGTYDLTVTDGNGCTQSNSWAIVQPLDITITETLTHLLCNGDGNGEIQLDIANGTTPYSYNWSTADGTGLTAGIEDQTGLSGGTYDLTLTDANGCSKSTSYIINEPVAMTLGAVITPVTCSGDNDGAIDITVGGGTPGYLFTWSTLDGSGLVAGAEDQSGLSGGTYKLTVTDANGCTQSGTYVLNEPLVLTITEAITHVTCFGDDNGAIGLTINGGTTPYLFSWSTLDGSGLVPADEDQTGLSGGTYDVTVTDASGCTGAGSYLVNEPAQLTLSEVISPISCNGDGDGAIDITVGGGTPGYLFTWSTLDGSGLVPGDEDQTGLSGGTYDVTVTDIAGCSITGSYFVNEPTALTLSEVITHLQCNGDGDGAIDITVGGGTPGYSFVWSTIDGSGLVPGDEDQTGLSGGTYNVTVTDLASCTISGSYLVNEPTALTLSEVISHIQCNGDGDGAIDITVGGGTPIYVFNWSTLDGSGLVPGDEDQTGLSGGTYDVTVTDNVGCTISGSYIVNEPTALIIDRVITNVDCNGGATGSIDVTVSGGISPYSFGWDVPSTDEDLAGLVAGTYVLTVTDFSGCTLDSTFVVSESDLIILTDVTSTLSCYGDSDGTISLSVTGGFIPYTYIWSTIDGSGITPGIEDQTGLTGGTYDVTVTDNLGCTKTGSYLIFEPSQITLSEVISHIQCNGDGDGAIDITVGGGTPGYLFNWSTVDGSGSVPADEDQSGLSGGTYDVIVTDNLGCTISGSYLVNEPAALTLSEVISHIQCNGDGNGAINITVGGGTPGYSFVWSTLDGSGLVPGDEDQTGLSGGTYDVTITDNVGCTIAGSYTVNEPVALVIDRVITDVDCNGGATGSIDVTASGGISPYSFGWDVPSTDEDLTGLIAGTYVLTVTDFSGCTLDSTFVVNESALIVVTAVPSILDCYGDSDGTISLTVSGGYSPFTYTWNTVTGSGLTPGQEDQAGLTAGMYYYTVTDSKACSMNDSAEVTQPLEILIDTVVTHVSCFGGNNGAIDVTIQNGVVPFVFSWSTVTGSGVVIANEDQTGLTAGDYFLTVTDISGCSATISVSVTEPTEIIVSGLTSDETCLGDCNGAVDLSVSGGVPGYSFLWSPISTNEDISGLCPATYLVTVSDANGCSKTNSFVVGAGSEVVVPAVVTDVICYNTLTGSINTTPTGGTGPYSFIWSNGAISEDLNNITQGTYCVTVSDSEGCNNSDSCFVVGSPNELTATIGTPPAFLVGPTTEIEVCFSGVHTWVSDLGFYMVGPGYGPNPPSTYTAPGMAGTVELLPSISDWYTVTSLSPAVLSCPGQVPSTCNSGDDFNNFCFTTAEPVGDPAYTACVCNIPAPLTGSYASAGPWDYIYGLDPAGGGWTLQVYDCIGLDVGALTNATITFRQDTGTAPNTNTVVYTYNSGNINSVIDDNSCSSDVASIFAAPLEFTVSCFGDCDGEVTVNVSGGVTPYSYLWDDVSSSTTQTISGLCPNVYSVTVTDGNGCTTTAGVTVFEPPLLEASITASSNPTCAGSSTGSATVTAVGGSPDYSYVWSDLASQTTATATGLGAGIYFVTVSDAHNCDTVISVTLTDPTSVLIDPVVVTGTLCHNSSDGSINLTVSGGVLPYNFMWSNAATTEDIIGLSAGIYSATVTDFNGCTDSGSWEVTEPDSIEITGVVTHILCNGANSGAIDITVTGGSSPISYNWDGVSTTEDISGLSAGDYNVTVTDISGCTNSNLFTVTEPVSGLTIISTVTDAICPGSADGSISLAVSGGTSPYSYLWSNSGTDSDITGQMAGGYIVTVTDANGCDSIFTDTIHEPESLAVTFNKIDAHCGQCDGIGIITNVTGGGTSPYSYSWCDGQTTTTALNLCIGICSVSITSSEGCQDTINVNIQNLDGPQIDSLVVTNVACNGDASGEIICYASGGVTPYSFDWSPDGFVGDGTNIYSSLPSGTYNVTLTDASGCPVASSTQVQQNNQLQVDAVITDPACYGGSDGSVSLSISGGASPFAHLWSNGETTSNISGISAGIYTDSISDANGCFRVDTFELVDPAQMIVTGVVTNVFCYGDLTGSIDLTVVGGTSPYGIIWSNASTTEDISGLANGTYSVTVTDLNSCQAIEPFDVLSNDSIAVFTSVQDAHCLSNDGLGWIDNISGGTGAPYSIEWSDMTTADTIYSLNAGTYGVTVTDGAGCTQTNSISVSNIDGPFVSSYLLNHPRCFGDGSGSIDITVQGGTSPYSFNWSDGDTSEDLAGLAGGTYCVTITDFAGCFRDTCFVINELPLLEITSVTGGDISCFGSADGWAKVVATGGSAIYNYSWTGPMSFTSALDSIYALEAGWYYVSVTDDSLCLAVDSIEISSAFQLNISAVITDATCFGYTDGNIDLTVSGGTSPISVLWSNAETTQDITGLSSGQYYVDLSDANGCVATDTFIVAEPAQMNVFMDTLGPNCGQGNGMVWIDSVLDGGGAPYSWTWWNASTADTVYNLNAGVYYVTVTSGAGCTIIDSIPLTDVDGAVVITSISEPVCYGTCDGVIDLTISGGVQPYAVEWSNSMTDEDISNLCTGLYAYTVTDFSGCLTIGSVNLTQPDSIEISFLVSDIACFGDASGIIEASVTGGNSNYNYSWDNASTDSVISNLSGGWYTLTASDVMSCSTVDSAFVFEPTLLNATSVSTDPVCQGDSSGSIDLTVNGGTAPYSFLWTNAETTEDISALAIGSYVVTVNDANGCSVTLFDTIYDAIGFTIYTSVEDAHCGQSNGKARVDSVVGAVISAISWNPSGSTEDSIYDISAGNYWVYVTVTDGCFDSTMVTINNEDAPQVNVDSIVDVLCYGENNGEIQITVTGGATPYVFEWAEVSQPAVILSNAEDFTGPVGVYLLTVTDASSCSGYYSDTINEPQILTTIVSATSNLCFGDNTGGTDLTISGGVEPYSILWNNAATSEDLVNVSAAIYSVTVTDFNLCTAENTIEVTQPDSLYTDIVATQESCSSSGDGSLDMTISGGTSLFSVIWSDGRTDEDISALYSGEYSVIVEDANGCFAYDTVMLDSILPILLSATIDSSHCGLCDGYASIAVSNGTPPFSFNWSNGGTTQSQDTLCGGVNYTVTITDFGGCTQTEVVPISDQGAGILSINVSDATCFGYSNGSIEVVVTGGISPYEYLWAPGGETDQTLTGLASGQYLVTVTDANNCKLTAADSVGEPDELIGSAVITDILCFGQTNGAIELTVTGGTSPYEFLWTDGSSIEDLSSLGAGSYTVTISDYNGCSDTEVFDVEEPDELIITQVDKTDNSCSGSDAGTISISTSGGTGIISYSINNGVDTYQNGGNFSSLATACYLPYVEDENGCISQFDEVCILEPETFSVTLDIVHTYCQQNIGSACVTSVSGNTGAPAYQWPDTLSPNDQQCITNLWSGFYEVTVSADGCSYTYPVNVNDLDGPVIDTIIAQSILPCRGDSTGKLTVTATGENLIYSIEAGIWVDNGGIFTGLPAGNYNVFVMDSVTHCKTSTGITIDEPEELAFDSVLVADIDGCYGECDGSIIAYVSGGMGGYTYSVNNGEDFIANTGLFFGLCAETYGLVVKDGVGCETEYGNVVINQPPMLSINPDPVAFANVTCNGADNGEITIVASGGTGALSYSVDNGITFSGVAEFTTLPAGDYQIVVVDENMCSDTGSSITITEPSELEISIASLSNSTCLQPNGTATVAVTGGSSPYVFDWPFVGAQDTTQIDTLWAGNYIVSVTDSHGCSDSVAISIADAGVGTIDVDSLRNVSCYGLSDGLIDLNITVAVGPYQILWNNGETTDSIESLTAGLYYITVEDANGCIMTDNFEISQPDELITSPEIQTITCHDGSDGEITLNASGGTLPYSIVWADGLTTNIITELAWGTYDLTLTDANGCLHTNSIEISNPDEIVLSFTTTDAVCYNGSTGSAHVDVAGGTMPYNYLWNSGETTENLFNVSSGEYFVTVTDAGLCSTVSSVTVSEPCEMQAVIAIDSSTCLNSDGSAEVTSVMCGGDEPYNYMWNTSPMQYTSIVNGLPQGIYQVTITNANGCIDSAYAVINDINGPELLLSSSDITCYGLCNGTADASATGTPDISFLWSDNSTDAAITGLCTGVYSVTAIDGVGCQTSDIDTIVQPEQIVIDFQIVNESCNNSGDGQVIVSYTGGTMPFAGVVWNTTPSQFTDTISYLTIGYYTVSVTDNNGCIAVDSAQVGQPETIIVDPVLVDPTCYGFDDGSINLQTSGGTSPYSYLWWNGETNSEVDSLTDGSYELTVTDANLCAQTFILNLIEPQAISTEFTDSVMITCGDSTGSITVSVSGGVSPYTYLWDDNLSQTTSVADSLPAWIYHVEITDANGCTFESEGFEMTDNSSLELNIVEFMDISCHNLNDAYIIAEGTGGNFPYTFNWYDSTQVLIQSGSSVYSDSLLSISENTILIQLVDDSLCMRFAEIPVVNPEVVSAQLIDSSPVTCNDICNGSLTVQGLGGVSPYSMMWSNASTDSIVTGLCSLEVLTVTVTDDHGCTYSEGFTIEMPTPISMTIIDTTGATCSKNVNDGSLDIDVSGGTSPFSYLWSDNGETTQDRSGLAPGWYYLTVTDSVNCSYSDSIFISPGIEVIAVAKDDNIICERDIFMLSADSSKNANFFAWSPYIAIDDTTISNPMVNPVYDQEYILYVEDTLTGCHDWDTVFIEVLPLPGAYAGEDVTIYLDEVAYLNAEGGESGSIYHWVAIPPADFDFDSTSISPIVEPSRTTLFELYITGSNGCSDSSSVTVFVIPKVRVPTGFTPNNDGNNDVWMLDNIEDYQANVQIYNRWGKLLFESSSYKGNEWDGTYNGKELPAGTYYFIITFEDDELNPEPITGPVTLIR